MAFELEATVENIFSKKEKDTAPNPFLDQTTSSWAPAPHETIL